MFVSGHRFGDRQLQSGYVDADPDDGDIQRSRSPRQDAGRLFVALDGKLLGEMFGR